MRLTSCCLLMCVASVSWADAKAQPNARQAVEGYVNAALTGKVDDASALCVEGQSPGRKKNIEEFKTLLNVKTLNIVGVHWSNAKNEAIAYSETIKIANAKPALDKGCVVFKVIRKNDKWQLKDIDYRSEEDAKGRVKAFYTKYPDAKAILPPEN